MATRKRTGTRRRTTGARSESRGTTSARSASRRSLADRWGSKSLMGHARTHPYASAALATAAAAGAGAYFWSRIGRSEMNMSALAI